METRPAHSEGRGPNERPKDVWVGKEAENMSRRGSSLNGRLAPCIALLQGHGLSLLAVLHGAATGRLPRLCCGS